jgi:hypothetical protein
VKDKHVFDVAFGPDYSDPTYKPEGYVEPEPDVEAARRSLTADVPVKYLSSDDVKDLLRVIRAFRRLRQGYS